MPQRSTPPIPFSPLKLLKADVTQDGNGVSMVLEFVDDNGTRLTTPSIPYPDNFDPMRIEHAEHRGDQIRIKNENGDTLLDVFADSMEYNNPIGLTYNEHGNMCIEAEEGEENLPLRTFSVSQDTASQVGWGSAFTNAFAQANFARQELDEAVQMDLNARFPDEAQPVIGASAWFRDVADGTISPQEQRGLYTRMGFTMTGDYDLSEPTQPTPKIKIDFDMKCTCCEGKIHYPDKLIQLLGEDVTIKYFEFCKKTKTEPQLFCCSCFGLMKNNSNQKVKKMMDLSEREEEVTKREKELDDQLKKVKKK